MYVHIHNAHIAGCIRSFSHAPPQLLLVAISMGSIFGTMVIGVVISLSSMLSFTKLIHGNPTPFAIKYSVGNTIALLSTGFLMGPKTQLKRMSHPTRWIAALVYVLAIAGTITFCFVPPGHPSALLVVICIIIQVWTRTTPSARRHTRPHARRYRRIMPRLRC